MAKVQGPLFSMDATGTYGGAITFGKWKGRNVARTRVDPANPKSSGQEASRNRMRLAAALQVWINGNTEIDSGETVTPLVYLKANSPSGQAWNGYSTKLVQGAGGLSYAADATAYAALTAPQKADWATGAAALGLPLVAVPQTMAGGAFTTSLTAGQAFFHLTNALFRAGYGSAAGVSPPTYA